MVASAFLWSIESSVPGDLLRSSLGYTRPSSTVFSVSYQSCSIKHESFFVGSVGPLTHPDVEYHVDSIGIIESSPGGRQLRGRLIPTEGQLLQ